MPHQWPINTIAANVKAKWQCHISKAIHYNCIGVICSVLKKLRGLNNWFYMKVRGVK
jgi:hypothetical protein